MERGRKVYNFGCYFCHGYNGDAKTLAADFLTPGPRDFTDGAPLPLERIVEVLRHGSEGTAMKSFAPALSEQELQDVAVFVHHEFVQRGAINTYYHTVENGWPDHRKRYGAAFPFALGEIATDTDPAKLTKTQRAGLKLFKDACVTCHDTGRVEQAGKAWAKYPLSHQGCGVTCHDDGSVDFPWERAEAGHPPVTPYEVHNKAPDLAGLSEQERQGEHLFQKNCAFCHAPDGTGGNWIGSFLEPPARDLTDPALARRMNDAALITAIRDGVPNSSMPAWAPVFDDASIHAVAAYVRRAFFTTDSGAD